jgi:uncharacterized coiled-coil protein SlyX
MAEISKQALKVENNQSFPNNNIGAIKPSDLRTFNTNLIDSTVNQTDFVEYTSSFTASLIALDAFTSSIAGTNDFTASQLTINSGYNTVTASLKGTNAFTASQLTINSGYNTFTESINSYTQSNNQKVDSLIAFTSSVLSIIALVPLNQTSASLNEFTASQLTINSGYNSYTASNNQKVDSLIEFTSSTISITALQPLNQASASLQSFTASANIRLSNLETTTASLNISVTNLNASSASQQVSINNLNTTTASLLIETSNLEIFTASAAISITNLNASSASQQVSINSLNAATSSYASRTSNVFSGSQTITGSVYGNVIPLSIVSTTASMDCSLGNFFTLTLANSVATHLTATNIRPGQTINLLVTQGNPSGSITYNSTFDWPVNNAYSASTVNSAKDIVSFIAFDNTTLHGTAVKTLV